MVAYFEVGQESGKELKFWNWLGHSWVVNPKIRCSLGCDYFRARRMYGRTDTGFAIIFSMAEGMAPGAMRTLVRPLTDHVGRTVSSCLSKSDHWVHLGCAACWKVAG